MVVTEKPKTFAWAVPDELHVPADQLRLRLDFHEQAVVMTIFRADDTETRVVSARDIAQALAEDLSFGTGLLPPNSLWWSNSKNGPLVALYVEPKVRILALQEVAGKPPRRFTLPLPGFIFLCSPGKPPWVYAVKKKPTKETDTVYHAPLLNVFETGNSCPGTNEYPTRPADIPQSFFVSFFTGAGGLRNRSQRFPNNVIQLWEYLDKKKKFPLDDLVEFATVGDLTTMDQGREWRE